MDNDQQISHLLFTKTNLKFVNAQGDYLTHLQIILLLMFLYLGPT